MSERSLKPGPDLGLQPTFNQDKDDLGLSSADIYATGRVLDRLVTDPTHDTTAAGILAGKIIPDLEIQLGYALKREEKGRNRFAFLSKVKIDLSDERIPSAIIFTLAGAAVIFTAAYQAWINSTPAAIEAARQQTIQFEKDHSLSTKPSSVSYLGWRVRRASDEEIKDLVSRIGRNPFIVDNNKSPCVGENNTIQGCTPYIYSSIGINLKSYPSSTGVNTVAFDVNLDGAVVRPASYETSIGDTQTGEIIAAFEDTKNNTVHFAKVTLTKSSQPKIQVEVQERKKN